MGALTDRSKRPIHPGAQKEGSRNVVLSLISELHLCTERPPNLAFGDAKNREG